MPISLMATESSGSHVITSRKAGATRASVIGCVVMFPLLSV